MSKTQHRSWAGGAVRQPPTPQVVQRRQPRAAPQGAGDGTQPDSAPQSLPCRAQPPAAMLCSRATRREQCQTGVHSKVRFKRRVEPLSP
eukprot:364197-Chlamydomonas_euryale.AAC.35